MAWYEALIETVVAERKAFLALKFDQIERIVGIQLPASARKYPAYWSKGNPLGDRLASLGWRVSPKISVKEIHFSRNGCEALVKHTKPEAHTKIVTLSDPDIVLIGCVKLKHKGRYSARDLYTSNLFRGRRSRAESTGKPWYILSAKYGLVEPDREIEWYDASLKKFSAAERRTWSKEVLVSLINKHPKLSKLKVEIHAGAEYRNFGLVEGLVEREANVNTPLARLNQGEQNAWYSNYTASPSVDTCNELPETKTAESRHRKSVVHQITTAFLEGSLNFEKRPQAPLPCWGSMPEFVAVNDLKKHGANAEQIRLFLTLVAALDRARDADRLWTHATSLYMENPWVFNPSEIKKRSLLELRDVLAISGVSQRHMPDSAAWRTIAEALMEPTSPATVKEAVFNGKGNAQNLLVDVVSKTPSGQSWFPFLAGPKISVMWTRIMAAPGDGVITNLDVLPVAVDVQVRKVTEYLGITETRGMSLEQVRNIIQDAWHMAASCAVGPPALSGTGAALDPALWFFAKWGCTFCERKGRKQPICNVCQSCNFSGEIGHH
jgi:hypothetical protein